ncbi:hypothetical protein [Sphingomonas oryzagri]
MAFEYENSGTVNVVNGSKLVSGVNTAWVAGYDGCQLNIAGLSIPVASIDSPTQLTLTYAYPGTTANGASYVLVPVKAETYSLAKSVNDALDAMNSIIENGGGGGGIGTVGPRGPQGPAGESAYQIALDNGFIGSEEEWLASLKGADGEGGSGGNGGDGSSGGSGLGSIVNLTDFQAQPAGGSGVYLIVPVSQGDPGISLTQSSQVVVPLDKPNAGIGMWIKSTTSGYAITLGLTNAPLSQPGGGSTDPIDLSGSATVYGSPGTLFDLGIYLGPTANDTVFNIDVPSGLPLKIRNISPSSIPRDTTWLTNGAGAPYAATGDATTLPMNKLGTGTWDFQNGMVIANAGCFLSTDALGIDFGSSSDDATTQTPPRFRIGFKGIVPAGSGDGQMVLVYSYNIGELSLHPYWNGYSLRATVSRNGSSEDIISDNIVDADGNDARGFGEEHFYEVEWINDSGGAGGTVRFYMDGVQVGSDKATERKLRISTDMSVETNALGTNTSGSMDNLAISELSFAYDQPTTVDSFTDVTTGTIIASDLQKLCIDATHIFSEQAAQLLTYTKQGEADGYGLSIVLGEMDIPAGQAYKVVLEDWTSGSGVPHANELVMTKVARQLCRFEDDTLFSSQAAWTEVLPQGDVPSINGIKYYCEGIKMGNYTQYQFAYDWDPAVMPNVPFGDPTGNGGFETYMVAHKWMIYDKSGTLLYRVEKPNGEPLNSSSTKPVWEGTYDGRSVPMITADNRHYPHGTVRSGVIWRSADPVEYNQSFIWNNVPTYDARVPFASQLGYSTNGFDLRFAAGFSGEAQMNGWANYRRAPWDETMVYNDAESIGANSLNPWTIGTNADAIRPLTGSWLKYTPFHSQGRSPITGPGGTRDDRQIMPEPVALYAKDVSGTRPHDNRPLKQIALHYLTGYVSDAVHAVENGRLTPLYKNNPRRVITMRNHYYGPGEASTPASQAYYIQSGRISEIQSSLNPLRVHVPANGKDAKKPYFGTFATDDSHAHQYPHWGSLMWQTPEFAMLGQRHWDQVRMYTNGTIIASQWDPSNVAERGPAWSFFHAAIAWKTASANSGRLYGRSEIMDFITYDFETFYDQWYASTPGVLNPPTNLLNDQGQVDYKLAMLAGFSRFGPVEYDDDQGVHSHDFFCGYWLQALHAAYRIGFIDALRNSGSPKTVAVINWLMSFHRKRIIPRINDAYLVNPVNGVDYVSTWWTMDQIIAAGGDVSKLPQNMVDAMNALPLKSPTWDTFYAPDGTTIQTRDGQANDQLLAGPAMLKDMGVTGDDVDAAIVTAEQRFQEKLQSEIAKGHDAAGQDWFIYHQATNNRPYNYPGKGS